MYFNITLHLRLFMKSSEHKIQHTNNKLETESPPHVSIVHHSHRVASLLVGVHGIHPHPSEALYFCEGRHVNGSQLLKAGSEAGNAAGCAVGRAVDAAQCGPVQCSLVQCSRQCSR